MKPAFLELRMLAGERASTLHWLHRGEQPGSRERTRRPELMEDRTRTVAVRMDRVDRGEVFLVVCQKN